MRKPAVIALDADDTLWHNAPMFDSAQEHLIAILEAHHPPEEIRRALLQRQKKNVERFGYGVKGFVLCMLETAIELSNSTIDVQAVQRLLILVHDMVQAPVELLPGVREAVEQLAGEYPLVLFTKGDLLDQESKLARSGLGDFFEDVFVVSEKNAGSVRRLLRRVRVEPSELLVVGNSPRSDVLPALEAGASAILIPYAHTWTAEQVDDSELAGRNYFTLDSLGEVPPFLQRTFP